MDNLVNHKYYKRGAKRGWLKQNGFKKSALSTRESDVFTYRFPIYKYMETPVIECSISAVVPVGKMYVKQIYVDVFDGEGDKLYHPFYYHEYGNYEPLFKNLNEAIQKELNRLGIKRKK